MDMERYVTEPPRHTKLYVFAIGITAGGIAHSLCKKQDGFWGFLLIFVGLFLVCGILSRLIRFFFGETIILTPEGIKSKSRIRTKLTLWREIIQAVAVKDEGVPMVVLLRDGGYKLPEDGNWEWFCLRNPGKLIRLPDEEQVHRFLITYYGSLDYDLRNKKKGLADL